MMLERATYTTADNRPIVVDVLQKNGVRAQVSSPGPMGAYTRWVRVDDLVFLPPTLIVHVVRSHFDDFLSHPGWWAVFDNPNLKAGDPVRFELDGASLAEYRVLAATVKECRVLGGPDDLELLNYKNTLSLSGWYGIFYDGWFERLVAFNDDAAST